MLDDDQKKELLKLTKAVLVNFIAEVQGIDKLLDKKIERLLLQSDKPKLIKKLTSTLKGLRRRHKVLSYWEYSDFVTELHYLIDDVMSLYPDQPQECLALLELFMESTGSSLERIDDSNGDIGDIYRHLPLLWLQAAAGCREQEKHSVTADEQDILSQAWLDKVKAMAADNDYGSKDNLLQNVNLLLSAAEIKALIDDYKYDYERLLAEVFGNKKIVGNKNSSHFDNSNESQMNANSLHKRELETALTDLAWALGEVETFEEVYLHLNNNRAFLAYEFDKLMTFMIEQQAYDVALRYLTADKEASNGLLDHKLDKITRLDWLSQIYHQQNNYAAQLEVLNAVFEIDPSSTRFKQIMAIASPAEKASLRKKASQLADDQEVMIAVDLWLEMGEIELANQVAVARYQEFDELHYTTLTQWLKRFPDDTNLIRVIIYRSLINDILDNARSMAYGHAARYYKHLVKLDGVINRSSGSYASLDTHQDYVTALKEMHSEKYGFWERVEG